MYTPFFLLTTDESYQGLAQHIQHLEASARRWRSQAERRLARKPSRDPEQQRFRESLLDQIHGEVLPRLSQYSSLLALCAVNEASLATLCRVVDARMAPLIPFPKNLLNPFPAAVFRYLRGVFDLPSPTRRFESRLAHLQHIRNCVAHCDGVAGRYRNPRAIEGAVNHFRFTVRGKDRRGQIHIPSGSLLRLVRECKAGFSALYKPMHEALRDATPPKRR